MVLACPMIQRPLVCLLAALWAFSSAHWYLEVVARMTEAPWHHCHNFMCSHHCCSIAARKYRPFGSRPKVRHDLQSRLYKRNEGCQHIANHAVTLGVDSTRQSYRHGDPDSKVCEQRHRRSEPDQTKDMLTDGHLIYLLVFPTLFCGETCPGVSWSHRARGPCSLTVAERRYLPGDDHRGIHVVLPK